MVTYPWAEFEGYVVSLRGCYVPRHTGPTHQMGFWPQRRHLNLRKFRTAKTDLGISYENLLILVNLVQNIN